ncbi:hypothetical protein SDC9_137963 [bioreactor metagenome]|uniref:DUF2971 domain-containing protein n=1 Tax=bioreactor metagenome TaxID=1076179 RepID=A0A645DNJ6_9ZZZZ
MESYSYFENKKTDMELHHYTTIVTLALILKNKTIRFNRLDKVDDLEEITISSDGINMSKYVFVSCWTKSDEESISLWKMYANGKEGVRISFHDDFFVEYEIKSSPGVDIEDGKTESLLPLSEILNNNYIFMPPPLKRSTHYFRQIEYIDDVSSKCKEIIEFNNTGINMRIGEMARYKNKRWSFQDEYRFVLTAFPKNPLLDINHPLQTNMIIEMIKNNVDLTFDNYYLKIKESAFDSMVITLCPSATESQEILVDSLIKEYAPNAKIKDSFLKGRVKFK